MGEQMPPLQIEPFFFWLNFVPTSMNLIRRAVAMRLERKTKAGRVREKDEVKVIVVYITCHQTFFGQPTEVVSTYCSHQYLINAQSLQLLLEATVVS